MSRPTMRTTALSVPRPPMTATCLSPPLTTRSTPLRRLKLTAHRSATAIRSTLIMRWLVRRMTLFWFPATAKKPTMKASMSPVRSQLSSAAAFPSLTRSTMRMQRVQLLQSFITTNPASSTWRWTARSFPLFPFPARTQPSCLAQRNRRSHSSRRWPLLTTPPAGSLRPSAPGAPPRP